MWQGGGQQRMPSGTAAQAVAEVVEALCQLFISALSRPHKAYHVTTAVCSGVVWRWHLAAMFSSRTSVFASCPPRQKHKTQGANASSKTQKHKTQTKDYVKNTKTLCFR